MYTLSTRRRRGSLVVVGAQYGYQTISVDGPSLAARPTAVERLNDATSRFRITLSGATPTLESPIKMSLWLPATRSSCLDGVGDPVAKGVETIPESLGIGEHRTRLVSQFEIALNLSNIVKYLVRFSSVPRKLSREVLQ